MNLGSPDSTDVRDVKAYLNEFLMDERVIDYPYLLRLPLVRGVIVPKRVENSAHAYSTVWTDEGSPLIVLTNKLKHAVAAEIPYPVSIAMRYGTPTPRAAFDELVAQSPNLKTVTLLPLYPHYAMSSYETAVEYARKAHKKGNYKFELEVIKPFYNDEYYINALSESIAPYLKEAYDHVLFSYHGLPERHMRKADVTGQHCMRSANCCTTPSPAHSTCYRHQCFATTQLVAGRLNIPLEKHSISFQSRLGREEWLKPYTAPLLEELPAKGIKKLVILCPAFVSDCLETLEEIAMAGKEAFLNAGGESFTFVPCLNVQPQWVQAIATWMRQLESGDKRMLLQ
jgi:ferrochelatase